VSYIFRVRKGGNGMELPQILERGERSRLFPVLAENSKEGRTLSIFLACLENIEEFRTAMFGSIGQKIGTRTRIETFTEVVLKKGGDRKSRPDGLIVLKSNTKQWTALVEAKVGNSELTNEQVEAYTDIAKQNGVDAIITLSNQFAALPTHHPLVISSAVRRKCEIFHWSWMFVLTQAALLYSNDQVTDDDQRIILHELIRFLSHPSAGVRGFDQMPAGWTDLVSNVQAGGRILAGASETRELVGAWHQEVRDLSLILSRQLGVEVSTKISRTHAADPVARLKDAISDLVKEECLAASFIVPDAAAPIEVVADIKKRCISVSMFLKAPADRKGTKARVGWLLRQLQKSTPTNLHIRIFWPGRAAHSQHTLAVLRENPDVATNDRGGQVALSFEILLVRDIGGKFAQRRNFISELEATVPEFYEQVGQYLKGWVASAPRLKEDRGEPDTVSTEAISKEAEQAALSRISEG
jgi:hypothetical protein